MSSTLRNLFGGRRQKKQQRQNKKGGKRTQKQRNQRRQRGGGDPLQKVVDMMKGGEGEQKMATEALEKAIGGSPNVMDKLQKLLPSP